MFERNSMKYRVAMIDFDYPSLDLIRNELAKWDCELDAKNCADKAEAKAFARTADGVICQKMIPVDGDFMDALEKCRVICRTGIGLDPIDVAAATARGIPVVHVPSYCEAEVADHAMSLLLACARKVTVYDRAVKSGAWDFAVGAPIRRLSNCTLGLVGFGKIPREVHRRAKGFGMRVIASDPFVKQEDVADYDVKIVSFDDLLAQSDFISLHCPLVDATKGMMNAAAFAKMKRSAFLINTARGPLVNEQDLAAALGRGIIAGAALDVRTSEPAGFPHPFNGLDNIILTPHAGFYSVESLELLQVLFARYTAQVLNGLKPAGLANPKVLERLSLK